MQRLLTTAGTTYAEEAGIRLKDKPMPLFQLLTLCDVGLPTGVGKLGALSPRSNAEIAAALVRVSLEEGLRDKVLQSQ